MPAKGGEKMSNPTTSVQIAKGNEFFALKHEDSLAILNLNDVHLIHVWREHDDEDECCLYIH